jgi:hypothetical protein
VYFITARCRDRYRAFDAEQARDIFWDRFLHYAAPHTFVPWVIILMNNHYHAPGYLRVGEELGEMMRKIHGSVAKLVNDLLPDAARRSGGTGPRKCPWLVPRRTPDTGPGSAP